MRAVVLVSGGGAVTPFTTPFEAATVGLAAGNTMTALRQHLLETGHTVFTAPARMGAGEVHEDAGWEGFSGVTTVLPASMTVNAVGAIDDAGTSLRAFLEWLIAEHAITDIDIVAHSMGGLFSRAALGQSLRAGHPLPVRRLITLGTPWTGALLGDHHVGDTPMSAANGDPVTEAIFNESDAYANSNSEGAAEQVTARYLAEPNGWNAKQVGVLDEVAVTLIGGSYFRAFDEPRSVWPHDGLVQLDSALAKQVSTEVLPNRIAHEFHGVHSIFVADQVNIDWTKAITWDPNVCEVIDQALAS